MGSIKEKVRRLGEELKLVYFMSKNGVEVSDLLVRTYQGEADTFGKVMEDVGSFNRGRVYDIEVLLDGLYGIIDGGGNVDRAKIFIPVSCQEQSHVLVEIGVKQPRPNNGRSGYGMGGDGPWRPRI